MMYKTTNHVFVVLLLSSGFFRVNSAYLAQSRSDGFVTEIANASSVTEAAVINETDIEIQQPTLDAGKSAMDPTVLASSTEADAKIESENSSSPPTDCDGLLVGLCMKRQCDWVAGKCVAPVSVPVQARNDTNATLETVSKMMSDCVEKIKLMWQHPPRDTSLVYWQTLIGIVIGIVSFSILIGVSLCTWRGLKFCRERRMRKSTDPRSNSKTAIRGKRLVLLLPQGRKVAVGDYVIDCTGSEPRTILSLKPGSDYIREPSVTDNMRGGFPCSSNSSLANMLIASEGSTNMTVPKASPNIAHYSGKAYTNDGYSISSDSLETMDIIDTPRADNSIEDGTAEGGDGIPAAKLSCQLPEPGASLYRPSEGKTEVELRAVKEEDEEQAGEANREEESSF